VAEIKDQPINISKWVDIARRSCKNASRGEGKNWCLYRLGIALLQPAICNEMTGEELNNGDYWKNRCYLDVSNNTKNKSLCNLITYEYDKNKCLNQS
jgi:hypothetical protein